MIDFDDLIILSWNKASIKLGRLPRPSWSESRNMAEIINKCLRPVKQEIQYLEDRKKV